MTKTRTTVRIAGRDYPISSSDTEAYVQRVARYVDRKITELSLATRLNALDSATLAAMTIADELAKSQEELTRLRVQLERERGELQALRADKEGRA